MYWYYMRGNDRVGPISDEELARLRADGTIGASTMVWRSMTTAQSPPPTGPAARRAPAAQINGPLEEWDPPPLLITATDVGVFDFFTRSWPLYRGQYWLLLAISVVGLLLGRAAPFRILLGPMLCGMHLCYLAQIDGRKVSFELLFKGFDHFTASFLVTLLHIAFSTAVIVPLSIIIMIGTVVVGAAVGQGNDAAGGAAFGIGMLLFVAASAAVAVLLLPLHQFAYPLIVDQGYEVWDSIKTAYRGAWANALKLLGLVIVSAVLLMCGWTVCCFGAIFVLPIIHGAWAYAYRCIFTPSAVP